MGHRGTVASRKGAISLRRHPDFFKSFFKILLPSQLYENSRVRPKLVICAPIFARFLLPIQQFPYRPFAKGTHTNSVEVADQGVGSGDGRGGAFGGGLWYKWVQSWVRVEKLPLAYKFLYAGWGGGVQVLRLKNIFNSWGNSFSALPVERPPASLALLGSSTWIGEPSVFVTQVSLVSQGARRCHDRCLLLLPTLTPSLHFIFIPGLLCPDDVCTSACHSVPMGLLDHDGWLGMIKPHGVAKVPP